MTEIPEWFKMTEGDQKPAEIAPKPKKHLFKVAAITAPLLIVGAVVFGATGEAEEEENAPAFDTTLTTTSSSTTAIPASTTTQQSSSTGVANPAAAPIGKPGVGVPMPNATGEPEDDDDEHEGRESHYDEDGH